MNNTISITYDKSPKDLTALTSFVFCKDGNVLQMKVAYVGSNAEEIIKIVTEQGYIDKIKANVRADAIYEYKHKLITDVSAMAQSFEKIHDKHDSEIFNYATRTFIDALKFFEEALKEQKNE